MKRRVKGLISAIVMALMLGALSGCVERQDIIDIEDKEADIMQKNSSSSKKHDIMNL